MARKRTNTIEALISEHLNAGKTRSETYNELRPMVEQQLRPMVFSANVNGRRVPKPISTQLRMLRYRINHLATSLNVHQSEQFDVEEISPAELENSVEEIDSSDWLNPDVVEEELIRVENLPYADEEGEEEEIEEEVQPVRASGKSRIEDAKRFYYAELQRLREFCERREVAGEHLDNLSSMRPEEAGARLIPAGIPPEALLHAITLHWSPDARNDANIENFDVEKLSEQIMNDREIVSVTRANGEEELPHKLFGYVLTLFEQRQLTYLVGPAGTGKSHLAKQCADYLGVAYGEVPMTPGATRGDLLGRHTIAGFIPAEFCSIYAGGGIMNLEEIDAADPSMLIVLNNALAQKHLYNSVDGEVYTRSADFIGCATGNTMMLGATREYTGREKLDAATVDRWRPGRVVLTRDETIAKNILGI